VISKVLLNVLSMISIIICSHDSTELGIVTRNIENTVGVSYEIIAIQNATGKYNIFTAYNEGIRKAKGEILCFMHEDVLFHTDDWGKKVENHLVDVNVGIIGVAGAHFLPDCYPVAWWENPTSYHLIQGKKSPNDKYYACEKCHFATALNDDNKKEVVTLDGLWLCGRRSFFEQIQFDANTFNGFHCYDIDICMQSIQSGKRNFIVSDILIEHKSLGKPNIEFYSQLKFWYDKWQNFLPIYRGITIEQMPWNDVTLAGYYLRQKVNAETNYQKEIDAIKKSTSYRLAFAIVYFLNWVTEKIGIHK